MKIDIPCIIFAGGKSSRMGEDKSLLPFGDFDSLIEYQYSKLSNIFSKVYISAKENKFSFTCNLIKDSSDIYAPTAGFVSIFKSLDVSNIFVLSVDTPFVDKKEIERLIALDSDNVDATIAKTAQGSHPMCGIYHRSLQPTFEKMLKENNHKLGYLLRESKTQWIMFEEEEAFSNLNHPHEYKEALSRLD